MYRFCLNPNLLWSTKPALQWRSCPVVVHLQQLSRRNLENNHVKSKGRFIALFLASGALHPPSGRPFSEGRTCLAGCTRWRPVGAGPRENNVGGLRVNPDVNLVHEKRKGPGAAVNAKGRKRASADRHVGRLLGDVDWREAALIKHLALLRRTAAKLRNLQYHLPADPIPWNNSAGIFISWRHPELPEHPHAQRALYGPICIISMRKTVTVVDLRGRIIHVAFN